MRLRQLLNVSSWRKFAKVVALNARMVLDRMRGRRVLILDLEEAMLLPFVEPVVRELLGKTRRISYYATFKTECPKIPGLDLSAGRTFDFTWARHMVAAHMFLSPHIWGRVPERVLRVHLPHGHPVKFACLPKVNFEHFNIHFVTGPLHREQTEFTIHHYGLTEDIRIFDVGLPKSDKLMGGAFDRPSVLRGLRLDPAKPTVIYAPSWESGLSLRAFREMLFDQFARMDGFNVIIKLHPASCAQPGHPDYQLYTGGTNWMEFVGRYLAHPHIRNVVTDEIDPLLAASDVMVSDISGVALEFLTLLKPVVYLDCPEFFIKTLPTLYKDFGANTADYIKNDPKSNAGRHVGFLLEDVSALRDAVRFVLDHPEYKLAERKEYAARIRYNAGCAAAAAADTILDLLKLPPAAKC